MNVLWLVSWYPDSLSPLSGDFVKRHAEAACLHENIHVISVVRDVTGKITKNIFIEESDKKNLKETIVYYYSSRLKVPLLDKLFSEFKYRVLFKHEIRKIIIAQKIDLVHVHVGMKAGNIARWIRKKYGIPYLVSEHWTGLLNESEDNLNNRSFFWKVGWKNVMQNAAGISAVSEYLATAIRGRFSLNNCIVIPNVVDTQIFYKKDFEARASSLRLIHISTFVEFKNIFLILDAIKSVLQKGFDVQLTLIGPEKKEVLEWIYKNKLHNAIIFFQEMPQSELAKIMQTNDGLILYSKYETFGCVVIEANACGLPVIAANIPVLHEIITDGVNGIFAPINNSTMLAESIMDFITKRLLFDRNDIAKETKEKYNYKNVGKMFSDWYKKILPER